MRIKNGSKFSVIIPRTTLAIAGQTHHFEQSLLQKLLTYLVRLKVKNLFPVLKTFSSLEVFRNFNGVKLPR